MMSALFSAEPRPAWRCLRLVDSVRAATLRHSEQKSRLGAADYLDVFTTDMRMDDYQ